MSNELDIALIHGEIFLTTSTFKLIVLTSWIEIGTSSNVAVWLFSGSNLIILTTMLFSIFTMNSKPKKNKKAILKDLLQFLHIRVSMNESIRYNS